MIERQLRHGEGLAHCRDKEILMRLFPNYKEARSRSRERRPVNDSAPAAPSQQQQQQQQLKQQQLEQKLQQQLLPDPGRLPEQQPQLEASSGMQQNVQQHDQSHPQLIISSNMTN